MKKLISLVLAAVMALSLVACGSGNKDKDTGDKTYKVGVVQLVQHEALDAATKGLSLIHILVVMNPALKKDFRFMMKQRGGMLAKGRLLGLQFDTLFTDGLYFKISRHANEMAKKIHAIFEDNGYPFFFNSPTNQQYPIMSCLLYTSHRCRVETPAAERASRAALP